MSAKKIAGYLHLWLGLASGIIVVIIGLTGSIYAFQEELKDIFYADKLFVTPHNAPVRPISELLATAEKALGKGKKVTRVEIENKPDRAYIFRAVKTNPKKDMVWQLLRVLQQCIHRSVYRRRAGCRKYEIRILPGCIEHTQTTAAGRNRGAYYKL